MGNAQLPEENVDLLWRQMGENKDWTSFMKAVMRQCGKKPGMDNLTVDYLVREAYDLNITRQSFPESAGRLYQVLTERLKAM